MFYYEVSRFYDDNIRGKVLASLTNIDDIVLEAINCAYGTAKRTFKGISAYTNEKEKAFENLAKSIETYLSGNPAKDRNDYTGIHKGWCTQFKKDMPTYKPTDGHAQKIINMTMKYLYCLFYDQATKSLKIYPNHFDYCHMTLDKFTLIKWVKPFSKNKPYETYLKQINYEWSKIDDYDIYQQIQKDIYNILNQPNGCSYKICHANNPAFYGLPVNYILPKKMIEAEFVIWQQEKINELREEIVKFSRNSLDLIR